MALIRTFDFLFGGFHRLIAIVTLVPNTTIPLPPLYPCMLKSVNNRSFFSLVSTFHTALCPFAPQIENIETCLGFLAAKGVNIKGLCAEGRCWERFTVAQQF